MEDPTIPEYLEIWAEFLPGEGTDGATPMQRQFYYMLRTLGMTEAQCLRVY